MVSFLFDSRLEICFKFGLNNFSFSKEFIWCILDSSIMNNIKNDMLENIKSIVAKFFVDFKNLILVNFVLEWSLDIKDKSIFGSSLYKRKTSFI